MKPIGKGSYGVVCKALNTYTNSSVAIKKITPMTRSIDDAKHVLREIRLMRHLGKHEHIVSLVNLIIRDADDELYIIMELLDSDLHRVLQSSQELSENHFRYFMYQLLCGIKYMHMNRIIHRDLKPGNLLISKDCRLRITDFGLARERPTGSNRNDIEQGINAPMTEHVVTRWYRSPELMLCPDGFYDYSVDIWSAGCILGEMLARKPLFPGKNFVHQLSLIFDVIGMPAKADVVHIKNTQAKKFLASQKDKPKVDFCLIYPAASSAAHSLLESILSFIPERRLSIDKCLAHAFITEMNYPTPIYPPISADFEFSYERKTGLTTSQLVRLINSEAGKIQEEAVESDRRLIAQLPLSEQKRVLEEWGNYGAQVQNFESQKDQEEKEEEVETRGKEYANKRRGSTGRTGATEQQRKAKESSAGRTSSRYVSVKPAIPKLSGTTATATAAAAATAHEAPAVVSARNNSSGTLRLNGTGNGAGAAEKRAQSAPRERSAPAPAPAPYPAAKSGMNVRRTKTTNNPFGTGASSAAATTATATVTATAAVADLPEGVYDRTRPPQAPVGVVGDASGGLFSPKPTAVPRVDNRERVDRGNLEEAVRSLEGSNAIQRAMDVLSPARAKTQKAGRGERASPDRRPPGSLWADKADTAATAVTDPDVDYSTREASLARAAEVEAGVKVLTDKYGASVAARAHQQAEDERLRLEQQRTQTQTQTQTQAVIAQDDIDDYIASVLQSNNKMMGEYQQQGSANASAKPGANRPTSAYIYNRNESRGGAGAPRVGLADDSSSAGDEGAAVEVESEEEEAVMPPAAHARETYSRPTTTANYYDTSVRARSRPGSAAATGRQQAGRPVVTGARTGSYLDRSDTEEETPAVAPTRTAPAYATANTRPSSSSAAGYRSSSAPRPHAASQTHAQAQAHAQGEPRYSQPTYRHLTREQEQQRQAEERAAKQTKKKRLTVPKSPKFSKMSYQRGAGGGGSGGGGGMGNSGSQRSLPGGGPPALPVSLTQMQVPGHGSHRQQQQASGARGGGLYDDDDATLSDDEPRRQQQQKYHSQYHHAQQHASERERPRPDKAVSNMTAKAVADYLLSHKHPPPPAPAPALNRTGTGTGSAYHSRPKSGNRFGGTR